MALYSTDAFNSPLPTNTRHNLDIFFLIFCIKLSMRFKTDFKYIRTVHRSQSGPLFHSYFRPLTPTAVSLQGHLCHFLYAYEHQVFSWRTLHDIYKCTIFQPLKSVTTHCQLSSLHTVRKFTFLFPTTNKTESNADEWKCLEENQSFTAEIRSMLLQGVRVSGRKE